MYPRGDLSTQKLWYSCDRPGAIRGCSPTTPSPTTSVSSPEESWMSHRRERSCAAWSPMFSMRTA
jgi:hypothetical protein